MNSEKKKIFRISLVSVILLISLWVLKDFNLSWVEVSPSHAKVTVNFLFPMNKDKLPESIELSYQIPYMNQFDYSLEWLTDSVVCIHLKEQNPIRGQKVQLLIKDAPSQFSWIKRSAAVKIQFQSEIKILAPVHQPLIATEKPFFIKFNTPMDKNKLHKFLECDASFYVEPAVTLNEQGKEIEDLCTFRFTPKKPLKNNQKYILAFRKGMPSESGTILQKDLAVILTTDVKPRISSTYPENNSKWIGLYPRLRIETDTPTVKGYVTLNNEVIKGKNIDSYHIEFILNNVLKDASVYKAVFQAEAASGELSEPKKVEFTTVKITPDRLWLEVIANNKPKVNIYKGHDILKSFNCSVGDLTLGTYYIYEKGEAFIDAKNREGANFWMRFSDKCAFQGLIRDAYWNLKPDFLTQFGKPVKRSNIILKDEDARWLYENTSDGIMVIIHQ